jgi:hypothetical protein
LGKPTKVYDDEKHPYVMLAPESGGLRKERICWLRATTFKPRAAQEGELVIHRDGNPKNNDIDNLAWVKNNEGVVEWIDWCENRDLYDPNESYSLPNLVAIKTLLLFDIPQELLAERFKLDEKTIQKIAAGEEIYRGFQRAFPKYDIRAARLKSLEPLADLRQAMRTFGNLQTIYHEVKQGCQDLKVLTSGVEDLQERLEGLLGQIAQLVEKSRGQKELFEQAIDRLEPSEYARKELLL